MRVPFSAVSLVVGGLLLVSGCLDGSEPTSTRPEGPKAPSPMREGLYPELAEDVRAEFLRAYQAYERVAGDHDEISPVSGKGTDFFAEGHPVALARIESLDTLYIMELDAELDEAIEYIVRNVSFDIDANFQVFETIIRVVGGLLSGYHATEDARLLAKAKDITDRLMPAFEKSPTGMPYRFVNLRTGAVSGPNNYLAEIGTCITEFGYLSQLTKDPKYVDAAKKALKAVYDRRSMQDLVGTTIHVETGQWVGTTVVSTINPPVDSFFEYLFEGYQFLGDKDLLAWFNTLNGAIIEKQKVEVPAAGVGASPYVDRNVWFSSNEYGTGAPESLVQSELAAFYAGLLADSGEVALGRAYHDAWTRVLDRGGFRILPEAVNPVQYQAISGTNWLRPEYVDAALILWLKTGDKAFVERSVVYYNNMKATSRVENGYTVLLDVTKRPETKGDTTPAYWYSENMKYYYLMFGKPARFDYEDHYMTTEGNVLRGLLHL